MTEFWSNHMHIPVGHDRAWAYRYDYDATIRQHALGTFEELLIACSLHPAMRVYLDNWKSVKNKPNENQGRELLELHTVGRSAGYTEAMVKASAVLLSGYTVDWGKTYDAKYDANAHTTGAVQVLDFSHPNTAADGQAATLDYLKYLANHPATARRIATKIATQFVSDSPSDGLVDTLAGVYTSSGTDIRAVLTALSNHPEFLTSSGLKVRTPVADLVATTRVLDGRRARPRLRELVGQRRELRPRRRPAVLLAEAGRSAAHGCALVGRIAPVHQLRHAPEHGRRLVAQGGGDLPPRAEWLPASVPAVRRVRRPPVPHLAGTNRRRTPAQGRHPGGHRTGELGDRHRVDHGHQQARTGELAVPAAGQRPPRHSRPHDDVRQTMTEHTHAARPQTPTAAATSPGRSCRAARCCREPRPSAAAWPSRRCSATRSCSPPSQAPLAATPWW